MKRVWMIAAAVLLTTLLATAGTLALFNAAADPATSTITAGRLCLTSRRDNSDPVPGPMFYVTTAEGETPSGVPGTHPTGYWAPGDTHRRTLIVDNPDTCSDMGAWLTHVTANLQAGSDVMLADKLWVEVRTDHEHGTNDDIIASGWMSQFLAPGGKTILFPDNHKIPLPLPSTRFIHFTVTMPLDTNNDYQGKSLVVDFAVHAVQQPNNP